MTPVLPSCCRYQSVAKLLDNRHNNPSLCFVCCLCHPTCCHAPQGFLERKAPVLPPLFLPHHVLPILSLLLKTNFLACFTLGAAKPREAVLAVRTGKTEDEILKEAVRGDRAKLRLSTTQQEEKEAAEVRGVAMTDNCRHGFPALTLAEELME